MTNITENLFGVLPEIFLLLIIMIMLVFGVFNKENSPQRTGIVSILSLLLALAFIILVPEYKGGYFERGYRLGYFSKYLKALILIASAVTLTLSIQWLKIKQFTRFEFPIIVLFATIGMMLMVSSNNIILLYVSIELQSLALYILAGYKRRAVRSTEAGMKYFLMGSFSSCLLVFGLSLIYGFTGYTNIIDIATYTTYSTLPLGFILGCMIFTVSLLFKLGIVPFHSWVLDVYEGAPTPVTAYFSTVPKIAIIGVISKIFLYLFESRIHDFNMVLSAFAVLSMFLGAIGALKQQNIKRMLAYSAINHAGYMLLAISLGVFHALNSVLFYLTIYVVMNLGVFACVLLMRVGGNLKEEITDLKGVYKHHPYLALSLSVLMFAMAGIPPTAGFFAKFYLFLSVVQEGQILLAVLGIIASLIASFYYLRIVKMIYFDKLEDKFDNINKPIGFIMILCALLMLIISIFPTKIVDVITKASF